MNKGQHWYAVGSAQKRSQIGFAGPLFLVIALIILVAGAVASMGRGNSSLAASGAAQTQAGTILKQGNDMKTGFDRLVLEAGLSPANVTFTTDSQTGLFDPVRHLVALPLPPAGAFGTSTPQAYTYNRQVLLPQVGASTRYDFVVTLGGVTREVCAAINHVLYADEATSSPATSSAPLSAWAGSSETAIDDSSSSDTKFAGRSEGCVQTADSSYVYYKALAEDGADSSDTLPAGSSDGSSDGPIRSGPVGATTPHGLHPINPEDAKGDATLGIPSVPLPQV
jgi:hypothetical protein